MRLPVGLACVLLASPSLADCPRPIPEDLGEAVKVFHAGTRDADGRVVTSGGRVLCTVALGDSVTDAQQQAYEAVKTISWDGAFYRTDIGYRAIARERAKS